MKFVMNTVYQWDSTLCLRIFRWNGKKTLDGLMRWLSGFGDGYAYAAMGLFLWIFNPETGPRILSAGAVAFVFESAVQKLVKHIIRRPRPCMVIPEIRNLVRIFDAFSFPSGHTAAAFIMAVLLGRFEPSLAIPGMVLASLIGFSRVYNGVHYPSDVLAGALLGLSSSGVGFWLVG